MTTNEATILSVGPFFDSTDGITPETGITVTGLTVEIYRENDAGTVPTRFANFVPTSSGGSNDMALITSSISGVYSLELTAAQLNFTGPMMLTIVDTDSAGIVGLPFWRYFNLTSANVVDAGYGTVSQNVNVASEDNIDFGALKKTSLNAAATDLSAITGDKDSYKATGFSTHDAAAVKTAIEAGGSTLAQILADSGELQTNQGNWLTATSVDLENDAITAAKVTDAAWQELIELFFTFDATATYGTEGGSVVDQIADNAGVATALNTTVSSGDTTTSFTLTAGTAADDSYNDMQITVTDGNGNTSTETRRINDWTSGRVVTVDTAFSFTPAAGDVVVVERAYLGVSVAGGDATEAKQDTMLVRLAAIMSKAAADPSLGTYNVATDSLEAQQENPQGPPIID